MNRAEATFIQEAHTAAAQFTVVNARGVHLQAATRLALLASSFSCAVVLVRGQQSVNARRVLDILSLCAGPETTLYVIANGERAPECVAAIGELVRRGFGDEDGARL